VVAGALEERNIPRLRRIEEPDFHAARA